MASASSIFCAFLLLQFTFGSNSQEFFFKPAQDHDQQLFTFGSNSQDFFFKPTQDHDQQLDLDPALNVFFRVNDLYLGKKMSIYFATNDDSTPTRLLSRNEANSIPFSSSKLPYLLEFFSFSYKSPQAKAMEGTLKQCELKPEEGEIKFCATSLESMLDMARSVLGMVKLKVLTTKILNSNHTILQGYTFVEKPLEIYAPKMVACHTMAYPYLVHYCHGQKGHFTKVFKIALRGENGERVDAAAVCHMDTSTWDPDHVAFRVLGGLPGSSPICHFLPANNIVWVASP